MSAETECSPVRYANYRDLVKTSAANNVPYATLGRAAKDRPANSSSCMPASWLCEQHATGTFSKRIESVWPIDTTGGSINFIPISTEVNGNDRELRDTQRRTRAG